MSQESEYEDHESLDEFEAEGTSAGDPEKTDGERADEALPYGMSGVTGILDKLSESIETGEWSLNKQKMVAEYILGLAKEYWLSADEKDFCQDVLAH